MQEQAFGRYREFELQQGRSARETCAMRAVDGSREAPGRSLGGLAHVDRVNLE